MCASFPLELEEILQEFLQPPIEGMNIGEVEEVIRVEPMPESVPVAEPVIDAPAQEPVLEPVPA